MKASSASTTNGMSATTPTASRPTSGSAGGWGSCPAVGLRQGLRGAAGGGEGARV